MRKRRRPSRITEGRSTSVWKKKKPSFLLLLEWVLGLLQEEKSPKKRGLWRWCRRGGSLYVELVGHKGSYIRDLPWPFCCSCCCLLCVYHYHYQVVSSSTDNVLLLFYTEVAFFPLGSHGWWHSQQSLPWLFLPLINHTLEVLHCIEEHLERYWKYILGHKILFFHIKR